MQRACRLRWARFFACHWRCGPPQPDLLAVAPLRARPASRNSWRRPPRSRARGLRVRGVARLGAEVDGVVIDKSRARHYASNRHPATLHVSALRTQICGRAERPSAERAKWRLCCAGCRASRHARRQRPPRGPASAAAEPCVAATEADLSVKIALDSLGGTESATNRVQHAGRATHTRRESHTERRPARAHFALAPLRSDISSEI